MSIRTISAGLLLAAGLAVASAAHADPVTYTQTIDHVTLRMPAPIGPKSDVTVTLAAQADTNDIVAVANVFGWPGKCVLTTSATITVTGVPTQTFASPIHVCATNSGERAGFYTAAGGSSLDFAIGSPSAYVIDLDLPTSITYSANDIRPGGGRPTLAVSAEAPGGGDVVFDYIYGVNDTFPNTAASTFVVDTAAAPPPAAVPTVSEWAMILMGVVLASLAALQLIRPAGLTAFFPRAGR